MVRSCREVQRDKDHAKKKKHGRAMPGRHPTEQQRHLAPQEAPNGSLFISLLQKLVFPPRCRPCRCCWWVRLIQVGLATLLHRPQLQHTHREQLSCQLDERNPQSALLPPRSGGDVAPTVSLEGRQACVRYHLHALRVSRQAFVTGGGGRASGGAQNMHG